MRYMIQSHESGEVYVSDGVRADGPLNCIPDVPTRELDDYDLDIPEAPDWVAAREGRILRESPVTIAARALGRLGGHAGRGESQRRGDSEHYRQLAAMRKRHGRQRKTS